MLFVYYNLYGFVIVFLLFLAATTKILNCTFRRNFANPRLLLSPRTYSGVGGAVFIESATAVVEDCFFFDNFATSGQFDSGGSGGAIGIENCYDVRVARTMFVLNSARGFDDTNTYSNSGSGGAISLMFSSAYIDSCLFSRNLVSAGGAEFSVGGAVAVFYNFLETSNTPAPPPLQFYNCEFTNNGANGEVCSSSQIVRAGQGGAVAIIGVALGGVIFNQSTFTRNIANTESEGIVSSFGGAVFYALGSKVSFHDCSLLKNVAFNGLGDDVCSGFAGDYNNDLQFYEPILDSVTPLEARLIHASLLNLIEVVCDNFDLQRNKDGNLVYPESVKDWSSRWDQIFNQFPDPWNGVAFTADPVSFEHEEALLFDNSPRKWEMYDRITNHRSSSPSLFFGFVDLRHFPSVLVSSGIASFYYPSFVNQSYQICAGDMLGLLADQGQGQSSGDTSSLLRPSLVIVGDVRTSALEIVGISANVTIVDQSSRAAVMMRSILIVNSTLYHSNNINVSASSAIIGSTISSFIPPSVSNITVGSNYMPVITFQGEIVTGFPSTEGTDIAIIKLIQDRIFSADINLLRSSIRIMGRITFSSLSNQDDPLFNHTVLFVSLYNRSTIFVETSGEMVIDAVTNILAENISQAAIVNAGLINVGDKDSSHTKGLRVYGNIIQTINATTKIRISNENYITPALVLASNFSFLGNLNVTTVSGTTFIPSSDSSNPSSWRIIEYFDSVESASFSELGLRSYYPDGLYFDDTMTYYEDLDLNVEVPTLDTADLKTDVATGLIMNLRRLDDRAEDWTSFPNSMSTLETDIKMERNLGINDFDNDTETWVHTITSSAMSCSARNDYYDFEGNGDSSDYRCHVCLHNASCGYCSGTMDGCQSTSSSSCDNGIYFHKANCCPDGCNNRGTCDANSDYTSFTCDCNIFWDGSSCDDLSIFTYLLTSVGIFSIVIALITVRYYFKYRHQKKKVLDDLRENLLGGGQNYGSMTQQSYLQGIQQDLILRDVFVPYEEIKLEKKIGEGSFGEVYLATFRGAQVAVKQMRAPVFLQFTDNDIEEFRKEAYMMSRLRHPNIVLVMGVSILEQEAPLPPPGYDDDEDISPRGRIASVDSMSDKKRTTSTDFRGGKKAEAERKIRSVCIITEYLEQGSLADILYGHNKVADDVWTYELVLTCALQAARGMLYLHSYQPPICHRDLKSSNLVVDDHWVVKVTDFGMSRIVPTKIQNIETGIDKDPNETMTSDYDTKIINEDTGSIASTRKVGFDESANETWERESFIDVDNMIERNSNTEMTSNLGTTAWCAPELLAQSNKTKYSVKVDVYSFGMVLWELWERKKPYEEMTSRFDIIDAVRAGRRPTISTNCPPTFRSLIQRCWHELPARRPTFAYIVRYIKDELAHIKRQRTMSTSFSPYSVSHLLNTQSTSGVDPSAAARAVQRAYNNSISSPQPSSEYPQPSTDYTSMRDTYEPPPITQIVEGDERDSVRKSSSLLSFMFKQNSTVSTSKSSVSDNQSISSVKSAPNRAWATPSHMQSPSDRNTISGADGLNRGPSADDLTYLAQTPVASSNLENIATSRDYQNGAASGGGLRQDQSTVRSHGQWRDKYVLKFNGWNSTKPDSNLPPSAARSTQSPLHADTHQRVRPPVSDDKSSEGSGGGHPSFEDSKEVYAHGKLLHPRSTYEMDLMSSSRSEGPRHGYDSKEEADRLQRKRTNSL
jgi:serine/threonine protein kinase